MFFVPAAGHEMNIQGGDFLGHGQIRIQAQGSQPTLAGCKRRRVQLVQIALHLALDGRPDHLLSVVSQGAPRLVERPVAHGFADLASVRGLMTLDLRETRRGVLFVVCPHGPRQRDHDVLAQAGNEALPGKLILGWRRKA